MLFNHGMATISLLDQQGISHHYSSPTASLGTTGLTIAPAAWPKRGARTAKPLDDRGSVLGCRLEGGNISPASGVCTYSDWANLLARMC